MIHTSESLKACIAQVERTSRCLVQSPPKLGDCLSPSMGVDSNAPGTRENPLESIQGGYSETLGSYWIHKDWHPDGHCWCWEVRQLVPCTGKYSKPDAMFWKNCTSEPFAKREQAEEYLKGLEI